MTDFTLTSVDGQPALRFFRGSFSYSTKGRIVLTNKNNVTVTINDAAKVSDNGIEFKFPASNTTDADLPATYVLQTSKSGAGWTTIENGTVTRALSNDPAEVEVKNDEGDALDVFVTNSPRSLETVAANITANLTAVGNTIVSPVDGYSTFTFYFTGTFAGANIIFEQSADGTNWIPTLGANIANNTMGSTTGVFASAAAWDIAVAGAVSVRARVTAITSGTISAVVAASTTSYEPAPAVGTHAVTGSGNFNVVPIAGTGISFATAASTNGAVDRTTAANLYELTVSNPTATPAYLKLYNKATAPTVGTDVPVLTVPVAATSVVSLNFGSLGKRFTAGIGRAVTGGPLATDTTATVAGVQVSYTYG